MAQFFLVGRRLTVVAALAVALTPLPVFAQTTDGKPLRLVVTSSPGSQIDTVARAFSNELSKAMGRPVVVDNQAGAGGVPGTTQVVRGPKDGLTLGVVSSNHAINPFIYKTVPYDALKDITPITIIGTVPVVLVVNPSVKANNTKELLTLLKDSPGKYNYGSAGNGTVLHLAAELFKAEGSVDVTHVAYKGTGPMVTDLLAGQVQMAFVAVPAAAPHIKAGKLKAIGVSTPARVPALPDVPTLKESGLPNYSFDAWLAIIGPAGLSKAVVDETYGKVKAALAAKEVQANLEAQGMIIVGNSPTEATAFLKSELDKHGRIVKLSGAKAD